jgi:hypothetical protein
MISRLILVGLISLPLSGCIVAGAIGATAAVAGTAVGMTAKVAGKTVGAVGDVVFGGGSEKDAPAQASKE